MGTRRVKLSRHEEHDDERLQQRSTERPARQEIYTLVANNMQLQGLPFMGSRKNDFDATGAPDILRILRKSTFENLDFRTSSAYYVCTAKVDFSAYQSSGCPPKTPKATTVSHPNVQRLRQLHTVHFANPDVKKRRQQHEDGDIDSHGA